jgi:hypothetical protein
MTFAMLSHTKMTGEELYNSTMALAVLLAVPLGIGAAWTAGI